MIYFIGVLFVLLVLFYMFPLAIVVGDSMYPRLKENEVYLARRMVRKRKFEIGSIYLYTPPSKEPKYVVKRLMLSNSYGLFFCGDNQEHSYDSRAYGYVDRKAVKAKVMFKVFNVK